MSWGMIGGAAVSLVGGKILSGSNSSSASQQAAAPTAANAANNPVIVADPFASQRYQYQPWLHDFQTNPNLTPHDVGAEAQMNYLMMGGRSQPLFDQAQAMLQPGYQFNSSDPSYQWRLDQGSENINRNAAASGSLAGGGVLAALQDYGQNQASTEFQNEYQRKMSAATAQAGQDQANFGEANQIDQNAASTYNTRFNQLALLSGAMTGSPTGAASQLASQQAGAAAQVDKYGNLIGKAGTAIWNYATDGKGISGLFGDNTSGSDSSSSTTPITDYASTMFGGDTYSGGNFGSPLTGGITW